MLAKSQDVFFETFFLNGFELMAVTKVQFAIVLARGLVFETCSPTAVLFMPLHQDSIFESIVVSIRLQFAIVLARHLILQPEKSTAPYGEDDCTHYIVFLPV